jgi:ABC-type dipeptide/oligopeptide/nickel transport system ATPase component
MANIVPIIDYSEDEHPWITYLKGVVFERNKCVNAAVVGETGSGKSWGSLRWCYEIDPDFELEGNWFFKAAPFMREINRYYKPENNPKKGKIWVLDEAGVDLYNLNYMDEINKGLNAFFQTARHRNYMFFGTVPFISFISKGVRKLMNTLITSQGYNTHNKTIFLPRVLQYNGELDQFYKKRLIVRQDNMLKRCSAALVSKPPKRLITEYEKRKNEFTSDLFQGIADRIEHFEKKRLEKYMGKQLTPIEENILTLMKDQYNVPEMSSKLDLTERDIRNKMKQLRLRGMDFSSIRDRKTKRVTHYIVSDPREKLKHGI